MKWKKIGSEFINVDFFKDMNYDEFAAYIKTTKILQGTKTSLDVLARKLGIEVPGKEKK